VSTTGNGQSPEMQIREFGEYCERRWWSVAGQYVDHGVSGSREQRPELDRSVSHLLRALETFQALGIEFVSLTEGVDTSTPAGKMVFTVLGAVAELERSLIAEFPLEATFRKSVPAQPVDATPANRLICQYFSQRTDRSKLYSIKPKQDSLFRLY
jgi:DNA invertase Pin-like site-specific DNA recombinase